jgi:alpha-tubulin suppressor-like RCC1 family protein
MRVPSFHAFRSGRADSIPASINKLWSWGYNGVGQLGQGDVANRSSPVQIGAGTDWNAISGGLTTLGVKTTGTMWAWGRNTLGQLGLGDSVVRSSPVQVGTSTDWSSVRVTSNNSLAIKTTGTLWAWGYNQQQQLGLIDNQVGTARSSPVQIGTDTDWASVDAGLNHSTAIKTNGPLWVWGDNRRGQLGIPFRTNTSSPVQIGSNTNWSKISAVYTTNTHAISVG